jgi:WD40 repeat protein
VDVKFSPNGKLLAAADSDGTGRWWNPATGQALGVSFGLVNAAGGVITVAFSPDGTTLASADTVRF